MCGYDHHYPEEEEKQTTMTGETTDLGEGNHYDSMTRTTAMVATMRIDYKRGRTKENQRHRWTTSSDRPTGCGWGRVFLYFLIVLGDFRSGGISYPVRGWSDLKCWSLTYSFHRHKLSLKHYIANGSQWFHKSYDLNRNLQFPNAVILNAVGCRNAQVRAKESK